MTIWEADYLVRRRPSAALIRREMRTRCLRVPDARSPAETIRSTATRRAPSSSASDAIELRRRSFGRRVPRGLQARRRFDRQRRSYNCSIGCEITHRTAAAFRQICIFCPWASRWFKATWRKKSSRQDSRSKSMNMFQIKLLKCQRRSEGWRGPPRATKRRRK